MICPKVRVQNPRPLKASECRKVPISTLIETIETYHLPNMDIATLVCLVQEQLCESRTEGIRQCTTTKLWTKDQQLDGHVQQQPKPIAFVGFLHASLSVKVWTLKHWGSQLSELSYTN